MILLTESDPHRAHICLIRLAFSFDQFALYDDTAGDYMRDWLGCIHTWNTEESIFSYLKQSKSVMGQAWVVQRLSGHITSIRCSPEISILTSNRNGAILYAERKLS